MTLLIYAPQDDPYGPALMDALEKGLPEENILVCDDMAGLSEKMGALASGLSPVLILVDGPELLDRLRPMADWLGDFPLFLILPDHNPGTVSKGFSFFPRYLGFVEQPPKTVVDILYFAIARINKQRKENP